MGVDATSSINSSVMDVFGDSASRVPSQVLDQDDFLKLLVAQMTTQDPMNPVGNTEFIAQMAQFTSLEQSRAMAKTMTAMSQQQEVLQANGLIGREVTVMDDNQNLIQGVVTGIELDSGSPMVVVGGKPYSLSAVARITQPVATATPDPTVPTDPVPTPGTEVPAISETSNQ